jgi:hypothetical protein
MVHKIEQKEDRFVKRPKVAKFSPEAAAAYFIGMLRSGYSLDCPDGLGFGGG